MININQVLEEIRCDNKEFVGKALGKGAITVNDQDSNGITPLYEAVRNNKLKIVTLLLEYGADVNAPIACMQDLVYQAASHDNPHLVKSLLVRGADVNAVARCGETAIKNAAFNRHYSVMAMLIRHGAEVDYIQPCDHLTTLAALIYRQNMTDYYHAERPIHLRGFNLSIHKHFQKSAEILIRAGATLPDGEETEFYSSLKSYKDEYYKRIGKEYNLDNEKDIQIQLRRLSSSEEKDARLLDSFGQQSSNILSSFRR